MSWGPQATGYAAPSRRGISDGCLLALILSVIGVPTAVVLLVAAFVAVPASVDSCQDVYEGYGAARVAAECADDQDSMRLLQGFVWVLMGLVVAGAAVIAAVRRVRRARRARRVAAQEPPTTSLSRVLHAADPLAALEAEASQVHGVPGGHAGWTEAGDLVSARPRGGMLVIGPPGSGKSSAVIIPSVLLAPGACVSTSIKGDVMDATTGVRGLKGRPWHFDPGGEGHPAPGVTACRWSPLSAVHSWDDARRIASRMAEPARRGEDGKAGDKHFVDRARDWVEVLLYAAHLAGRPVSRVAEWAVAAGTEDAQTEVLTCLIAAEDTGDEGAGIAKRQLEGLIATPDRERGSIISTMSGLLRIYSSIAARRIGDAPNFDPAEFVRSSDTLYITASPERQQEYAPLIASMIEEIRYAVYARHRAHEQGREPWRPHVTFVLDEANNTAPVPLPAIISEAGGQSLHVIVGIQDLSRARARWGKEADGFLTLFPTKLVLPGVIEPYTLDALSNATGEYDRLMVGYGESVSFVGEYNIPVRTTNPSYSLQRQRVLSQGDIANLPDGTALLWEGAKWWLVSVGMHWQHPVWRLVTARPQAAAIAAAVDHAVTQKGHHP